MPSESEVRDRLQRADAPSGRIDVEAVVRRSRARRRPRVVAAAAVTTLAVIGVVVPVSLGLAKSEAGGIGQDQPVMRHRGRVAGCPGDDRGSPRAERS